MEDVLTLEINDDIKLYINAFSETLIDASRDSEKEEVYVRINLNDNDNAIITGLKNIDVITKLDLKRNDEIIWTSDKYSTISKLALDVMDTLHEYVLVIV